MPLTGITTFFGSIIMLGSWIFIGQRLKTSQNGGSYQSRLLHQFFLFMGLFFLISAAPHTLIENRPADFPLAMAVAYVIGHIFVYLAFLSLIRMMCSIIPGLNHKETLIATLCLLAITAITVFNAITMIWGTRPEFSQAQGITLPHAHPLVAAFIAIFGGLAMLPTAIMMIINGITGRSNRLRSFLLGGGLTLLILAGPLHDIATNAQVYITGDVLTDVALLTVAGGVAYRIEDKISVGRAVPVGAH